MKNHWLKFLWSFGSLVSVMSYGLFPPAKSPRPIPERPNLLIILVDQWRGEALGFEKQEPVITPNLDQFVKESFVEEQMISNHPICSPARAMLMTGQYSFKNQVTCNINSTTAPYGVELQTNAICWSDLLKANGYFNGYIGKWHLDAPHSPYVPTSNNNNQVAWNEWTSPERRHGFDYWYAYGTYDEHLRPMYWDTEADREGFHYVENWGPVHETEKALEFLKNEHGERKADKPFSLVVSMNPPHSGYNQVPRKYIDLYQSVSPDDLVKDPDIPVAGTKMGEFYRNNIKLYYAAITGVDEQIGKILKGLVELKLDNNTVVIFMADHGNCLGKHEQESKNNMFEASIRIPFMIRWPGHIEPRVDSSFLGSIPDIYPTVMDLLGLANQIPKSVEGRTYKSYFLTGHGKKPDYQYLMGGISPRNPNSGFRGIRTNMYKLVFERLKGKETLIPYLFDLKKDPFEMNNIFEKNSPVVETLRPALQQWLTKEKDPFTIP